MNQVLETSSAAQIRVMTCNVYKGAASAQSIVNAVREQHVQVLALQETTVDFVEELEAAGIDELLPHSERSSSDGVYGNGVWSAHPLADVATDDIGSSASAMPAGTVSIEREDGSIARVRLVSVHTCSPGPGYWDLWRRSIEEIGVVRERVATDNGLGYVLLGDFNATYDHAPFREMLGEGEAGGASLHDAAREAGQGIVATWPSGAPTVRHRPRRDERWHRRDGPRGAPHPRLRPPGPPRHAHTVGGRGHLHGIRAYRKAAPRTCTEFADIGAPSPSPFR